MPKILLPLLRSLLAVTVCLHGTIHLANAGGVTVITHGFSGNVNGWIAAMADQIPRYPGFPGTNFSLYTITLTTDGNGNYSAQSQRTNATSPLLSDSGEIIVKLDWSQMAGSFSGYDISTYDVAQIATSVLLATNTITELGGHALAELPVHLIGHSRGGSLISEMSRLLGTNGIWVDHLTTLDPHPLNNDGFIDPLTPPIDAPVHTYANILFHDNYWEDINSYPKGEQVAGAYVRPLDNALSYSGGYSSAHSDVHLWYHGTIDWSVPSGYSFSGDSASISAAMRTNWWVGYENSGHTAGFLYSLIGRGDRLSFDQPLGPGSPAIRDGYNRSWDLGAGVLSNRTSVANVTGNWPNLLRIDRLDHNPVPQGSPLNLRIFYQWARPALSNSVLRVYLDDDSNPLNTNQTFIAQYSVSGTGANSLAPTNLTVSPVLNSSNIAPGWHHILASITSGGRTRLLYGAAPVLVIANQQPPVLDIAWVSAGQLAVGVNGTTGQSITLESSSNLVAWDPLVTNTLSANRWVVPVSTSGAASGQYFRARVN